MKLVFYLSDGQLKVISQVLSNLAAAWLGSIAILPGVFGVKSLYDLPVLLTYSFSSAIVAMYFAAKIEDQYL